MITLRKPYIVSQNITYRSGVVVADTLSGTIDNANQTYYTTYDYKPDHITFFYNGQALHSHYDFEETGTNEVKLLYVKPYPGDNLRATYELAGSGYSDSLSGSQPVAFNAIAQVVNFGTTFSGTDYVLSTELITTDGTPSVYGFVVGNKTASGFTVHFSGEIDSNNYTLEWIVML